MTKQIINTGTSANSKTGDSLRTAFTKINENFTELYAATATDVQIPTQTSNGGKYLTTNGTTLSWATVSADRITSGSHSVVNDGSGALVLNDVQYIYAGVDGKDIDIYTHSNNSSELWLKDNGPAEIITNGGDYIWTFGKDGVLTLPNISTIDASEAQVGYSYGPYDIDIYYNTTGGALDSGHLTYIDIGVTAHNNLFNAPIAPRSTITGTIAANGNFTPGTPTVGTFTRFNLIRVGGVNLGGLEYRDDANPSAGLRIGPAGSPYTGPTVTAGTVIEGWSGRQTVAPKTTTYIRWADGSNTQVTGSQVRFPGEAYAGVVTTDNVSGKHFPATLYTANYSAATTTIGMNAKQWQFDGNGTLTFPNQTTFGRNNAGDYALASFNDLVLKSKKSVTISSGEDIGALETSYTNSLVPLTSLLTALTYMGPGYPASHTSYAALAEAQATNPLISDELVAFALAASDAWNAWQAVLNSSAVTIGVGNNGWHFGTTGSLTFPNYSTFDGQTLSNTNTGVNYTLKIANGGGAGSVFGIGTGDATFGIANDALNHAENGYVPYTVTAQLINLTVPDAGTWRFDTDGNLTIPGDIRSEGNINIDINLSDSTLRRWQFGEDGSFTAPGPIYGGSNTIGLVAPAPLNLNNTGPVGQVKTQLNLINTAGNAGTGSAIDYFTYVDQGNGLPGARLQAVDDNAYSANFSIALKGKGNTGNNGLTTVWTFGSDGRTTFPDATVPAHSYGAAGDKAGMIAFDSTYIYYCTANYVNTSTNIWKRTAHGTGSW